jgi:hypothetical protein
MKKKNRKPKIHPLIDNIIRANEEDSNSRTYPPEIWENVIKEYRERQIISHDRQRT